MPNKRGKPPAYAKRVSKSFHDRYDQLEEQRHALMLRLSALGEMAQTHDAYGRALTLLNNQFRKATLMQRAAVLHAAEWLINVLERLTTIV